MNFPSKESRIFACAALGLLALTGTGIAQLEAIDLDIALGTELRAYLDDPNYALQPDPFAPSFFIEPELSWESADRSHQLVLHGFYRRDLHDDERSHGDLREAYWLWAGDEWEVLVGADKIFWGVTETRHLVDIINQDDAVEDIDGEDKLGQPMLRVTTFRDWGTLSAIAMPYFRERSFPGIEGRPRIPLIVDTDSAVYEDELDDWYPSGALRYAHSIGNADLGAHYFHGIGREPRLLPNTSGDSLIPHYDIINQIGVDAQYTTDALLLKLEAISREGQGDDFFASVAGFEYTFYGLGESGWDLGVLSEYLYDGRDANAPPTPLQNDIAGGLRLVLNDSQDTALLAGGTFDTEGGGAGLFLEATRRLGDSWVAEFEARLFEDADQDPGLAAFANDSFLNFRITRYF